MKIGVLAYHSACNFGANLQLLSTVGYLKRTGHTPIVLNYEADDFVAFYKRITAPEVYTAYADFRERYMPLSRHCDCADRGCNHRERCGCAAPSPVGAYSFSYPYYCVGHTHDSRPLFPKSILGNIRGLSAEACSDGTPLGFVSRFQLPFFHSVRP